MAFAPRKPIQLAKKRRAQLTNTVEDKIVLDRVLGLTCVNNNLLGLSQTGGFIVYPAGCTVVLLHPKRNKQYHIINPSRKPISCLCVSSDDKYLAYGECGHSPLIRIWDISGTLPTEVVKLPGHSFGVSCVAFSPNLRYLVSVGYQHDQNVFVWSWRSGTKVATNKITTKISGISFSEDGKYFVTVGCRRVRYWYFDTTVKEQKIKSTHPLNGRSAILGDQQNRSFVAVRCGRGHFSKYTYVITASGQLFQFNENREVDKLLDVQSGHGVIRLFDPITLDYVASLPRPHYLGVNLSAASEFISERGKSPDTVALGYDNINSKLIVIYNDHSLYTWDVKNTFQIGKANSFLYHNACIWDICVYPLCPLDKAVLPVSSFITCSSDDTIRFWSFEPSNQGDLCLKNIYSKELFRIIYDNNDTTCLRDTSKLPGDCTAVSDTARGTRCIEVHPLGHHLAAGDRQGNLKVYDLNFTDKINDIMAHDAEILSISYSSYHENETLWLATASRDRLIHLFDVSMGYRHTHTISDHSAAITSVKFIVNHKAVHLVSCGADKSLMVQEVRDGANIKRVNHVVEKSTTYDMIVDPTLKTILTVGQDRMIRMYSTGTCKQKFAYRGGASEEGSTGLLKVAIDPSGLLVATSGSDKIVCVFECSTGELLAKLYGHSEVITALKFSNCCNYLYTASGDSCIFIWKLSRDLRQKMCGRLAEIGRSYHLPQYNTERYESRKDTYCISTGTSHPQTNPPTQPPPPSTIITTTTSSSTAAIGGGVGGGDREEGGAVTDDTDTVETDQTEDGFKFSLNQLPAWAQRQIFTRPSVAASVGVDINEEDRSTVTESHASHVTGKWAERSVVRNENIITCDSEEFPNIELESEAEQTVLEVERRFSVPAEEFGVELEREEGEEEEEREEVIYPIKGRESVDPSMFKVSTPERKASVSKPSEVDKENINDNPEMIDLSSNSDSEEIEDDDPEELVVPEEELFLKANFESLSASLADEVFQQLGSESKGRHHLSPGRPSISTLYLFKSRSRVIDHDLLRATTPPIIDLTTPPNKDNVVQTPTKSQPKDDTAGMRDNNSPQSENTNEIDGHKMESNLETEVPLNDHVISRPRPIPPEKSSRAKITPEEISKARKRLEELGYSEEYIHGGRSKKKEKECEKDQNTSSEDQGDSISLKSDVEEEHSPEEIEKKKKEDSSPFEKTEDYEYKAKEAVESGTQLPDIMINVEEDGEKPLPLECDRKGVDQEALLQSAQDIANTVTTGLDKLAEVISKIKEPLSLAVCSSYGEEVPVAATLAASLADVDQQFVHLKKVVEQKGLVLQGPDLSLHVEQDPVHVAGNPGQDPAITIPDPTIKHSQEPLAETLDQTLILPLIEQYSEQLVEAVKSKLARTSQF